MDTTWTIEFGCTRHITYEGQWFSDISASGGSITVDGKNQISIEGVGRVGTLLTPKATRRRKSSWSALRSKVEAQPLIGSGWSEARFPLQFRSQARFNVKAPLAWDTDLYQFQAKPAVHALAHIATSGKQRTFLLLHKRLGHPNIRILQDRTRSEAVRGLDGTTSVNLKDQFFCRACTLAKSHRAPFYYNRVVERARAQL
ncbi:LOW QUALITY PROTEIN: Gag-pol Polyprotein [Phytophthora palmivora]|uniref:Gag-pol Polyprotein n=1 Tax=Phytophthora palmivora TaxID=4796 RepID=A0A2P4YGF2_9STRA|nr:LOW QUALITY PROTEIN: Gag-pol Polyprotein [Phytophthora palmivora]